MMSRKIIYSTIRDVINFQQPDSKFLNRKNAIIADRLEQKSEEFYQIFKVGLIFFIEPGHGFDYCRFIDLMLEPVPLGFTNHQVTIARYGKRGAILIGELIKAGNTKETQDMALTNQTFDDILFELLDSDKPLSLDEMLSLVSNIKVTDETLESILQCLYYALKAPNREALESLSKVMSDWAEKEVSFLILK
jgi:hypothetical protein